ncbi:hypothetical protein D6810_02465 [Candidatus Dojkabacteria bacterium]|uniref:Uncharacterized protein n=1 Tax=Candidatus Dojkabacteria bacterium TaxID=2099670 RepID=A0A3M0Z1N8_9BACT|nr:MAG: hypothetical protein D6810_02465 [Candidatus Dojkabacteria bacterium]
MFGVMYKTFKLLLKYLIVFLGFLLRSLVSLLEIVFRSLFALFGVILSILGEILLDIVDVAREFDKFGIIKLLFGERREKKDKQNSYE